MSDLKTNRFDSDYAFQLNWSETCSAQNKRDRNETHFKKNTGTKKNAKDPTRVEIFSIEILPG